MQGTQDTTKAQAICHTHCLGTNFHSQPLQQRLLRIQITSPVGALLQSSPGGSRLDGLVEPPDMVHQAPFAGIVTKRYLNSGVLVSPGTAILNIAQIDRVRLQANVAEQDLNQISVGAEVMAHTQKGGRTIRAVVISGGNSDV